jgi:DNA polymerase-2
LPTTRRAERGSKKRYAGTVRKPDGSIHLVVRGLEAVRRDWSPIARRVQRELLRRVFADEPFEEWLAGIARDLALGLFDDELVYRKRVRRTDDDESSTREIEYVMTTRGLEPIAERSSPLDHEHYVVKQLAPVCDVVLPFVGASFDKIAGAQTSLF